MTNSDFIQNRIFSNKQLSAQMAVWQFKGKRIVFTNGCFDIIHPGHIAYLSKAKDFGDILVIGLNSDDSVRQLKGENRPIIPEKERAFMLASLRFVDAVVIFDEETPINLIQQLQPDVLVKGKDYKAEEIVGYDIVTAKGGAVETIELVEGFSTTSLIDKLKQI